MAKYIGKRIVPIHCGMWTKDREYEMLSIVLDEATGDSYISRRQVPSGTPLQDVGYWALHSLFSQQIANMGAEFAERQQTITQNNAETISQIRAINDATEQTVLQSNADTLSQIQEVNDSTEQTIKQNNVETLQQIRDDNEATRNAVAQSNSNIRQTILQSNSETLSQIRADNDATEQTILENNDATEQAIAEDNTNTRTHVDEVTGNALAEMNRAKSQFDATSAILSSRLNSIAGQATSDTEILDARVDAFGREYENLGEAIRSVETYAIEGFRTLNDIIWIYGFWNQGGGFNSNDTRRIRGANLVPLKKGQRIRFITGPQYASVGVFRKIGDTGVKNDDYERIGASGWQNGVYEYVAPEDVYVEIVVADEADYNQASKMSTTEVSVQIFLLDNYAAQVLSESENAVKVVDDALSQKTDNMDITAKGEVILTDNRYPEISGYTVFLGGNQLYFAGEKQWKVIKFTDIKQQLGDVAEIVDGGIKITMGYNSILGFDVIDNVFAYQTNFQIKPHICPLLYCYYGYMYGKFANRNAYRKLELNASNIESAGKLRISEKGFVYIAEGAKVRITDGDSNGGLVVRLEGSLCVRFKGKSASLKYADMTKTLGDHIVVDESGSAATIMLPRYSQCLVVSTADYMLYIRNADGIQPEDFVLLYNGYRNKIGYLVNLETMQRVGELEKAAPSSLNKDSIAEQAFNSSYHKDPVNFQMKAQQFSFLLNGLDKVETFLFFTDPHLAEFSRWENLFREYLVVIQQYYNSTPTSFCLCGGDWLGNSDLPETACFKLGYIDGVMKYLFQPYYPIVGNHDTNYQGKATEDSATYTTRLSNAAIRNLWYRDKGRAYYDFRGSNTRFFVFDTGTENESMEGYQWAQCQWFAEELMGNEDEHIVIAQHIVFYSLANQSVQPIAENILSIAEAFNNRTTISVNEVEYNFTNANGKVEFIIAGHNHTDGIFTLHGIPVIITVNVRSGDESPNFDLCLIDYDNREFKMIRIGGGDDRTVAF